MFSFGYCAAKLRTKASWPNHCSAVNNLFDMKLAESFYLDPDVVKVAKNLLGKFLVANLNGGLTSGMIVETEAYSWKERGCHAFQGKKTNRNAAMFGPGGVTYVYLCYGMYELFNVVTNETGVADAVLIRALEPVDGQEIMMQHYEAKSLKRITSGPGKLTKALGITRKHNMLNLTGDEIWIEDRGVEIKPAQRVASARIGLNFDSPDASLPWRFTIKGNVWVSK
jgi:DNA-3-methyladenine glycosylase